MVAERQQLVYGMTSVRQRNPQADPPVLARASSMQLEVEQWFHLMQMRRMIFRSSAQWLECSASHQAIAHFEEWRQKESRRICGPS